eukprot:GHVS01063406.1.p1 GENE.GHVS01063406.1~~GHVS01063406.1.p1  ORF type:complete len:569 (+),score=126.29 GHVS01063406.1:388-2094(+)
MNSVSVESMWAQQEEGTILAGLFSTKKPRDLGAGLSSGLKSVGKGVAIGAASLVVLPAIGASQEGIGGFFKGFGAGVLAAVALPITALTVAGYQVGRGVMNTPEAVQEKATGHKWDKKKREWKENWYSLQEEEEELKSIMEEKVTDSSEDKGLPSPSENGGTTAATVKKKVVDTEFYDLLEVPTDATQNDIRKQYYKLARRCHPDKNPDDPNAKLTFQKIGEAYQVLGDEDRRAKYDVDGSSAALDMPIIDSSLFFMMLFGSEALEPYIGKLKMAMLMEMMGDKQKGEKSPGLITEEGFEVEQRRREIELAMNLRERLCGFVDKSEGWEDAMKSEAAALCNSSFGDAIVEAIGWVYENYSTQYLGKLDTFWGLGGRYAKMQAQSRSMGNSWKTASSAVRAAVAARRVQQTHDSVASVGGKKKKQKKGKEADKTIDGQEGKAATTTTAGENDGAAAAAAGENGGTAAEQKAAAEAMEETLPLILETMLNICLMDIEQSVRAATKKVLKDMSVELATRRLRAEGVMRLGQLMQTAADEHRKSHTEKVDARRQMEEAFIKAAQKADDDNRS